MNLNRITILANADIFCLLNNVKTGITREYLVINTDDKDNYIIFWAGKIKEACPEVTISINAKFKYGYRNVKIEIAFFNSKSLFLVKALKNPAKLGKEALKLDLIISDLKLQQCYTNETVGCFLVANKSSFLNDFNEISKSLKNKFIFITENEIINKIITL